jgi:hypothetical protein
MRFVLPIPYVHFLMFDYSVFFFLVFQRSSQSALILCCDVNYLVLVNTIILNRTDGPAHMRPEE